MKARGFTIIEAVLIVAVVGIVSALGVVAYNQFLKPKSATTTANSATTAAPVTVTAIKSSSDLDKAASDLQNIDVSDSSDTSTIDTQASGF